MKRHSDNTNTLNISGDAVIPLEDSSVGPVQPSEEVTQSRHQAIEEEVAYRRAEERGFAPGGDNGRMASKRLISTPLKPHG
jgi:hypothetical protein